MKKLLLTLLMATTSIVVARPENQEKYVLLEQQTFAYLMANPTDVNAYRAYAQVVKEGWKMTWAEHNPGAYNLLQAGIAAAGVAVAAYAANQTAQPAPQPAAQPAPRPQQQQQVPQAPGGPRPPAYAPAYDPDQPGAYYGDVEEA